MGIEGGHRAVPCMGCHKELAAPAGGGMLLLAKGVRKLPFTDKRARCEDCHADPHRGQFAGRGERGRCASCHDVRAFRPARLFDHDRDTKFRLAGAHAEVACTGCHKLSSRDSKGEFVLYRPTPVRCEECHRPGSPELRGRP